MSKKKSHKQDLAYLIDEFLTKDDEAKITEYLISKSNLPGPRGNLELAEAFAETVEDFSPSDLEKLWCLCMKFISLSPQEAPVNNPREFLSFCGDIAAGAIGSVSTLFFKKALSCLHELANDPRWRVREAVAMGNQKLLTRESRKTLKELERWVSDQEWLAMRAVAAGVAEPALLKDEHILKQALELHKKIFAQLLANKERKSEGFKTLKKALAYSLSVVVSAIPREGFEYMRQLIETEDADIIWIVKENLKKNRLVKNFPYQVDLMQKSLK